MNLRNDENGVAGREISARSRSSGSVSNVTVMPGFPFANVPTDCSVCCMSGFATAATVTGCDALPPPGASATGHDAKTGSRESPDRAEAPRRSDPHGEPPSCRDCIRAYAHLSVSRSDMNTLI